MRLSWGRRSVRTRARFATARGGITEREVLDVALEHDGLAGLGEAVPSRLYGQSIEASEAALAEFAEHLGDDPHDIHRVVERCIATRDGQRAAIAALDSALHDWVGKRHGLPVWRLLGLPRPCVRTTLTIGVAEPAEVRAKIAEATAAGFRAIKAKVGVDHDHETLRVIREVFDGPLLLDANEAWDASGRAGGEAAARIRGLAPFRPALIEQPVPREQTPQLATLRELGVAPIFADESCERPADVVRLRGLVDGVNIKLTKCGGVREALRMIELARALELGVMLGCFVSTSLAIAPALAIASLADWVDLDGHLLIADDPYTGIVCDGGSLSLSAMPGLGVGPRSSATPP